MFAKLTYYIAITTVIVVCVCAMRTALYHIGLIMEIPVLDPAINWIEDGAVKVLKAIAGGLLGGVPKR